MNRSAYCSADLFKSGDEAIDSDAVYSALRRHFSEEEIVKITVAIGAINIWNRLAVGFRALHPVDAANKAA